MDYVKEYIEKNPTMHLEDSLMKVNQIIQVIPPTLKVKRLLDVACGAGLITIELAKKLNSTNNVGVDISKEMIKKAKLLDKEKLVKWKVADIFEYKAAKTFDLVTGIDILEHIENDKEFLKTVSRLGKFILIRTPLEKTGFSTFLRKTGIYDPWKDTEKRFGHIHHYDEQDLYSLFKSCNLKIVKSVSVPLAKRSKLIWEIFRLLFYPIALFSLEKMVKVSGGFKIILLKT